MATPAEIRIAELEGRVHALEQALARRSNELRRLQRYLSKRDLIALARLAEGLLPLPTRAYEPTLWRETTQLEETDVEEVLLDLWQSLYPEAAVAEAAAAETAAGPKPGGGREPK